MNRIFAPIFALALLFPSLALGAEVTIGDLVERDGLFYEKSTDVPFTGEVTGQGQGQIKDGKREGPWVAYRDNDQLLRKGDYKGGKRDGPWIVYWHDGTKNECLSGTYRDGVKISRDWDDFVKRDDGLYYEESCFVAFSVVPFSGEVSDGSKRGRIEDGKLEDSWVEYWDDGQLRQKGDYKDGKRDGPWVRHWDNGQLHWKGGYKDGTRDGPWVWYNENGQLAWTGDYKGGERDGLWVVYWHDGQLEEKGDYKDGEKDGPWVESFLFGFGQKKGDYKNGLEEGPWIWHYETGELWQKGDYKDGKREGPWVTYNKDGTKDDEESGIYRGGKKIFD